jgi:hypothetical protein
MTRTRVPAAHGDHCARLTAAERLHGSSMTTTTESELDNGNVNRAG